MAKTQTLEQSFEKLEQIIGNLENGDVSLEDSFKLYNEGMKLIQNCNQQLDKVEKKIVVLNQKEGDEDEF
jgi:exodeoxyribonuclease VII small subunit